MRVSHRGRTASDPTAPAQSPACSVPAPGSAGRRASARRPRLPTPPGAGSSARRGAAVRPARGQAARHHPSPWSAAVGGGAAAPGTVAAWPAGSPGAGWGRCRARPPRGHHPAGCRAGPCTPPAPGCDRCPDTRRGTADARAAVSCAPCGASAGACPRDPLPRATHRPGRPHGCGPGWAGAAPASPASAPGPPPVHTCRAVPPALERRARPPPARDTRPPPQPRPASGRPHRDRGACPRAEPTGRGPRAGTRWPGAVHGHFLQRCTTCCRVLDAPPACTAATP
jgi:hypothetical protein